MNKSAGKSAWLFLTALLFIAGCSSGSEHETNKRIAAEVNGVEITKREVDFQFERTRNGRTLPDSVAVLQKRRILAGIVRAELLAQEARNMKLDRTPEFVMATHTLNRTMLSGLAEREIVETVPELDQSEKAAIVTRNPDIFLRRKAIFYEEAVFPVPDAAMLGPLDRAATSGSSFRELLAMLEAKKIGYRRQVKLSRTDAIPAALRNVLLNAELGRPKIMLVNDKVGVILLKRYVAADPLKGEAAVQMAGAGGLKAKQARAFSERMQEIVNGSEITYYDEYSPDSSLAAAAGLLLPQKNEQQIAARNMRRLKAAAAIGAAFLLAMMLLSAAVRVLKKKTWLPFKKNAPHHQNPLDQRRATPLDRTAVFLAGVVASGAIGHMLLTLSPIAPWWVLALGALAGLLLGVGGSYLFALSPLGPLTKKRRTLPLLVLLLLLAMSALVTKLALHA
ncbi:EpsD family peptidyl-prolyl cis-trans isomerase [Chlorobium sp. N1]|uniref:EpsD family peptidyl-prolyl cis-trans isomerase n=1 Tax=Chlorobium sp. N1 TaxID=2491138 RepID=UPI0013F152BE|nr:EpsD family peptidyl-prolyl cis-trans isomerase [Chlorobium sp. N1]